jgi:predicted Zn-dependent protease
MPMNKRSALLVALSVCLSLASAQPFPRASPIDNVAVYLIPSEGFPEELSATIARTLTKDTGLWVKSSLRIPATDMSPLPGTNQYAADDFFAKVLPRAKALPEASPRTYYVILTTHDINSRSQNFRFQFSSHSPMLNASVVSLARLLTYSNGNAILDDAAAARLYKMTKRAVGEMRLGWKRSADTQDLMYAPIMSIEDLDRIGLEHMPK